MTESRICKKAHSDVNLIFMNFINLGFVGTRSSARNTTHKAAPKRMMLSSRKAPSNKCFRIHPAQAINAKELKPTPSVIRHALNKTHKAG